MVTKKKETIYYGSWRILAVPSLFCQQAAPAAWKKNVWAS